MQTPQRGDSPKPRATPWELSRPYFMLALVWCVYFHPLVLRPSQVLYSDYSDFLAEHLPAKIFLNREWRETGELPLWNPYHFCGTPFVHDIQVGCFYPPYAAMYVLPESDLGAAMSWVIALHVLAAGVFAYWYARSHDLGEAGSLVVAVGFAFSAKWMTHLVLAGHTITIGLAWLPLVLMGLEKSIGSKPGFCFGNRVSETARNPVSKAETGFQPSTRRIWPAIGAGVAFAMLALGTHPQWTFYAGVFVAAWTVPAERTGRNLVRWAGSGVAVAAVAVLLCAVQLFPTWEASRYSARSAGLEATQSLQTALYTLFALVGPSATYDPPATWESRALLGTFWLAAAFAAPKLSARPLRWKVGVLIGLLAFSLGGAVLLEWLPGFNLFRVPSRMLLIAAFPIAYLAGTATDSLIASGWAAIPNRALSRSVLLVLLFAAVPSVSCVALSLQQSPAPLWPEFVTYWVCIGLSLPAIAAVTFARNLNPRTRTGLWLGVLLIELLVPTFRFVEVRPQSEIYPESDLVKFLEKNAEPGSGRVIDMDVGSGPHDRLSPLGGGSPLALVYRTETPRGYNPLDVRHYREFINFAVDRDEQVLGLNPVAQPIIPNFPRTNPTLFDLLNVRYLVCFEEYTSNPELQADPGHRLGASGWKFAAQFPRPPAIPALPPNRSDPLPRLLVMENQRFATHPRAFVVPRAKPMLAGRELEALKATDFSTTVLLTADVPLPPDGTGPGRAASLREYRPNRVTVDLAGGEGGFLVLGDVWFPGWVCRVDGLEVPIHRANHAFRAVAIPTGAKEAAFSFEPRSYRIGWWVSAVSLGMLLLAGFGRTVGFAGRLHRISAP